MPRASFSHNASLTRPAIDVWTALQDAATWSGIGPVDDVWDATHDDDGHLQGFSWSAHVGPTKYKGSAKVTVAAEPHHMKFHLDSSELSGALIADIDDDAAILMVTLEVASKGAMASMFFPIIAEAIGRGLPQQVEEFASTLNGEEDNRPQPI
ncbi:MAG: SRPBCC family protein [Acidimicrobiia bacterium]|nr:SRPBCC family protein [Acidimicrobiia bacterium]